MTEREQFEADKQKILPRLKMQIGERAWKQRFSDKKVARMLAKLNKTLRKGLAKKSQPVTKKAVRREPAGPYAYPILPVELPSNIELKDLVSRRGWERIEGFMRVEALLRSEEAQQLYKDCGCDAEKFGGMLNARFGVPTSVSLGDPLAGDHHIGSLAQEPEHLSTRWLDGGVIDLTEWVVMPNPRDREYMAETLKKRLLDQGGQRYVMFEVDLERYAESNDRTLKAIQAALDRRVKQGKRQGKKRSKPSPFFRDLSAWMRRFKVFDLRQLKPQPSFGDIAKQVYGTPAGSSAKDTKRRALDYKKAQDDFEEARDLVNSAVSGPWPPRKKKKPL